MKTRKHWYIIFRYNSNKAIYFGYDSCTDTTTFTLYQDILINQFLSLF
jgi:hypothetical protein